MNDLNEAFDHPFRKRVGGILASGQSHSVVLTGDVKGLFYVSADKAGSTHSKGRFLGLVDYLRARWGHLDDVTLLICPTNGQIRFMAETDRQRVQQAWEKSIPKPLLEEVREVDEDIFARAANTARSVIGSGSEKKPQPTVDRFQAYLNRCINQPTAALRLLKLLCEISRESKPGDPLYGKPLLILVESADMLIPEGEIGKLQEEDRRRVALLRSWFSDMEFMHGKDSVVLIAESMSLLHRSVMSLPQVLCVDIPAPDLELRSHFIEWFGSRFDGKLKLWGTKQELAEMSAGLTLHALHQMLIGASHEDRVLEIDEVIRRVEEHIIAELGEGVVEFKRPTHTLVDVVGFAAVKTFIHEELIPGFRATNKDEALTGAAIAGAIGSGKTFVFEAVASELGMLVLVLKGIRSKWFGETDLILERLYRVLISLGKVMILMDEADTLLGGVGADVHETERRATGKIQGWMSDPALRGKVVWLLMTARIHQLSPDIRRPGRVGDLIIPMLDPEGDDYNEFLTWMLKPVMTRLPSGESRRTIEEATRGYSAASFDALRRKLKRLKARKGENLTPTEVIAYIKRQRPADIGLTRRYQTLQALLNCTDTALLPNPEVTDEERHAWEQEIRALEAMGIR